MTTIVYDHKNKLIACDSRLTQGGFIATDEDIKYKAEIGGMWFFCGNKGETDLFIEKFKLLDAAPDNINVTAIYTKDGKVYLRNVENNVFRECELNFTDGCGSGCEHAINALDFGMNITDAMNVAFKRDCFSGGHIHIYDVDSGDFID